MVHVECHNAGRPKSSTSRPRATKEFGSARACGQTSYTNVEEILNLHILVIDDEPTPRQSWFNAHLEELGCTVAAAHSSTEACALLREHTFDLAFFDHDLGEDDTGSSIATRILMDPQAYHCPRAVWVHSANPVGALNIASKFQSVNVPTAICDFGQLTSMPVEMLQRSIHELVAAGNRDTL